MNEWDAEEISIRDELKQARVATYAPLEADELERLESLAHQVAERASAQWAELNSERKNERRHQDYLAMQVMSAAAFPRRWVS